MHMKILAMLLLASLGLEAQSRPFCSWNCSGVPVNRGITVYPWRGFHRPAPVRAARPVVVYPGVSTGTTVATAVASAAIAGVVGYELGRKAQQRQQQAERVCKDVTIDGETTQVCKNKQGQWSVEK
jgi:hypothetical protein